TRAAWHESLRNVFMFLAVPLAVFGLLSELSRSRQNAEYRFEAVCDELRVKTTAAGSVELRPTGFRTPVVEAPGLSLTTALFAEQDDGTNDPDLAAVTGNHPLIIKPLKSSGKDELPFAAVTVDQDSGPDIHFELDSSSGGSNGGELRLKWDRDLGARQALKV